MSNYELPPAGEDLRSSRKQNSLVPPKPGDPDYEIKVADYERQVAKRQAAIAGLNRDEEAWLQSQSHKPDPWE